MTRDGEAGAQNEVDEVRWVPLGEAPGLLTYERDRRASSRCQTLDGSQTSSRLR